MCVQMMLSTAEIFKHHFISCFYFHEETKTKGKLGSKGHIYPGMDVLVGPLVFSSNSITIRITTWLLAI